MKKHIYKLLTLIVSLALTLSLSLPVYALEDTDPPLWEQMGYTSLESLFEEGWLTQEEYAQMVQNELEYQAYLQEEEANRQSWIDSHSQEVAAFDPYAYYAESYVDWYTDLYSAQDYMEFYGISEEEFYQEMLDSWVQDQIYREMAQIATAEEKTALGGSPDGVNVMVDGICIPFPDVRPTVENGRTMVPLAFFAQSLGYEVYWDDYYETAVLLDREALADSIDQEFTLLNRVLYALTGNEFSRNGNAMTCQTDLKLELTEDGKTYPLRFQGSALMSSEAVNLQFAADLSSLTDLLMEGETPPPDGELVRSFLTSTLSDLELELIYSPEENSIYLRGAVLGLLALVEDPESWAALSVYDELFPLLPPDELSVGQLLTRDEIAYGDFFHLYSYITAAAHACQKILGDDCFTQSGSSYAIHWNTEDLDLYAPTGSEVFDAMLKISPVGDKGCSFSASLTLEDSASALKLDCSGSQENLALELSGKNLGVEAFHLELDQTKSTSSQSPLTRPPEGDPIEYPAGNLGIGTL